MKKIITLVLTVVLMVGMSLLNRGDDVTGTWEGDLTLTLLGEAVEEEGEVVGIIRFTFAEDGTGTLETFVGLPLAELPIPGAMDFTYTAEDDLLSLTFENGREETVPFWKAGDHLILEGDTELSLYRE